MVSISPGVILPTTAVTSGSVSVAGGGSVTMSDTGMVRLLVEVMVTDAL
jgi:hypothetical protein